VLQINFVPLPWAFARRLPPELWMLRSALEQSDCVVAVSRYVADMLRLHFGVTAAVVPPPLRIDNFPLGAGPADGVPTLLSVADFNARRKGLRVLVQAYAQVKRQIPELRLRLSGALSEEVQREVIHPLDTSTRSGIEVLGVGRLEDVPLLYQSSSVLVLPSMYEAAGMVMLEGWASGAVAVGTRHGGIPEFITPQVGTLFEPETEGEETMNVDGLAEAIHRGIKLSQTPGIREKCRTHAQRFSWEQLGPKIEELYVA
jgi:phosphatidylinositol alpha-mannosyltransferase